VTIAPVTPYLAGEGGLSKYFGYCLGWRRDEISINNQDLVTPANSWNKLVGINSPKATITFFPEHPGTFLRSPSASANRSSRKIPNGNGYEAGHRNRRPGSR